MPDVNLESCLSKGERKLNLKRKARICKRKGNNLEEKEKKIHRKSIGRYFPVLVSLEEGKRENFPFLTQSMNGTKRET